MPWKGSQQRAIAARLRREGKSKAEVGRFFRRHGQGGKDVGEGRERRRRRRHRRRALERAAHREKG